MNCLLCSKTEDLVLKNNLFGHCIHCKFCEYYKRLTDESEIEPYNYLCETCNKYWESMDNTSRECSERLTRFWITVNDNHFLQNHSSIEIV